MFHAGVCIFPAGSLAVETLQRRSVESSCLCIDLLRYVQETIRALLDLGFCFVSVRFVRRSVAK